MYTQPWQEAVPAATDIASAIDAYIKNDKIAVRERIADILGIADFTLDPLVPTLLRLSRTANAKIIGGSVNTSIRNNADNADNILITDAGIVTLRNNLITTGYILGAANTGIRIGSSFFGQIAGAYGEVGYNNDGTNKYLGTDFASRVVFNAGGFLFQTAPSGIAGNAIAYTTAFSVAQTGIVTFNFALNSTGIITGNLNGNVTGNLAGNVTGNLTGNVTGNTSGSSGSCTGNSATATILQTARAINGVNFDGSAPITITALTNGILTFGTHFSFSGIGGTFNGQTGTLTLDATASNTINTVVARNVNGDFDARVITATLAGNANTATAAATLQTARNIAGSSFNGSADINIDAANLSGNTLAGGILTSSLTSVGTLANLTANGIIDFSGCTKLFIKSSVLTAIATENGKIQIDTTNSALIYITGGVRYSLQGVPV